MFLFTNAFLTFCYLGETQCVSHNVVVVIDRVERVDCYHVLYFSSCSCFSQPCHLSLTHLVEVKQALLHFATLSCEEMFKS